MESLYNFYYNELKEKSMTMQVAMLAKDGFLIASDRLVSGSQPTSEHRKIFVSESGNVVVAAAGFGASGRFTQHWLRDLGNRDLKTNTEQILAKSVEDSFLTYGMDCSAGHLLQGTRLLVIVRGIRSLWEVVFAPRPYVELLRGESESYAVNGSAGNQASFFAHQYFSAEKSVDQLLPIAAHTILEGARIEPSSVGGLDIYVSRTGESPRFLDSAEIDALCRRSEELHNKIASEFI